MEMLMFGSASELPRAKNAREICHEVEGMIELDARSAPAHACLNEPHALGGLLADPCPCIDLNMVAMSATRIKR